VANTALNSVSVTMRDVEPWPPLSGRHFALGLSVDQRGTRLWWPTKGRNTVKLIDTFANRVVTTTPVESGSGPYCRGRRRPAWTAPSWLVHFPRSSPSLIPPPARSSGAERRARGGRVSSRSIRRIGCSWVKEQQSRVTLFDMNLNVELGASRWGAKLVSASPWTHTRQAVCGSIAKGVR